MPRLSFWYDFASTYAFLSAMRIEAQAGTAGVDVTWRPFLLGPIFRAQGWSDSPFNIYPAKGRYMVRDIERVAAGRGLVFQMPARFPANGLLAARLALALGEQGHTQAFSRSVFHAAFVEGRDIADPDVLSEVLSRLGLEPDDAMRRAHDAQIKDALRAQTDAAVAAGVFGAPTFQTEDGELF